MKNVGNCHLTNKWTNDWLNEWMNEWMNEYVYFIYFMLQFVLSVSQIVNWIGDKWKLSRNAAWTDLPIYWRLLKTDGDCRQVCPQNEKGTMECGSGLKLLWELVGVWEKGKGGDAKTCFSAGIHGIQTKQNQIDQDGLFYGLALISPRPPRCIALEGHPRWDTEVRGHDADQIECCWKVRCQRCQSVRLKTASIIIIIIIVVWKPWPIQLKCLVFLISNTVPTLVDF